MAVFEYQDITYVITRRGLLESTLFHHHLPSPLHNRSNSGPLAVALKPNTLHGIVSAGAPADLLLLAVAPEKWSVFPLFDFCRQALIPCQSTFASSRWDDSPGAPTHLAGRGLWRYIPIWSLIAAIRMRARITGHGRLANRHKYHRSYCLTGNWNNHRTVNNAWQTLGRREHRATRTSQSRQPLRW